MTRRQRISILLILMLLGTSAAVHAKTTVTLWSIAAENGTYGQVFKKLIPKIQEQFPDVEINVEYNATAEKFTVAIAGGVAPDIVILATRGAGSFVEKGLVAPLDREVFGVKSDAELRSLFYGGAINSMYMADDVYFMPTEVTTLGTFANLDMLAEAGLHPVVPETWEEMLEAAKRAVRRDENNVITKSGLILNRHYIWPSLYWLAFVRQAGVDWLVNGEPQFTHPDVVRHIEFYQSLYTTEAVAAPNANNSHFFNGNGAFYVGGQYELAHMFNPDRVRFEWASGGFPYFAGGPRVSTSYAWGMYVYSGSPVQRTAWEIINALTTPENARVWYETSSLLIPRAGDWIIDALGPDPRRLPFIFEFDYAQMEFWHPESTKIIDAILRAEQRLVNQGEPAPSVLQQLNQEIRPLL